MNQNEPLSIEQVIFSIKNMPDLLMEHNHGIIVDNCWVEDDLKIIDAVRKEHIAKARWLDYYLLDDIEALRECDNTDKAEYKPLAEITLAWYKLAQEVFVWQERHPENYLFSRRQIKSPAFWMTICETQFCSSRLINSLSSARPRAVVGKGAIHLNAIKYMAALDDVEKLQFVEGLTSKKPIQALEEVAALLSKYDSKFRYAGYFSQYRRTIVRCLREIRYNKSLPFAFINSEGIFRLLERGQSTRGFG